MRKKIQLFIRTFGKFFKNLDYRAIPLFTLKFVGKDTFTLKFKNKLIKGMKYKNSPLTLSSLKEFKCLCLNVQRKFSCLLKIGMFSRQKHNLF